MPIGTQRAILNVLIAHPGGPLTMAAIAKLSGYSERTVQRTVADLERAGAIRREPTARPGSPYAYQVIRYDLE